MIRGTSFFVEKELRITEDCGMLREAKTGDASGEPLIEAGGGTTRGTSRRDRLAGGRTAAAAGRGAWRGGETPVSDEPRLSWRLQCSIPGASESSRDGTAPLREDEDGELPQSVLPD